MRVPSFASSRPLVPSAAAAVVDVAKLRSATTLRGGADADRPLTFSNRPRVHSRALFRFNSNFKVLKLQIASCLKSVRRDG